MNPLRVKEIFHSLQGEGGKQGEASIFIRLAGCNLHCDFCDTDFSGGRFMETSEILTEITKYRCNRIIWTGGEPTLQLKSEHIDFFNRKGYLQSIESNGTMPLPDGLDYIVISPKIRPDDANDYYRTGPIFADEIRLPFRKGDKLPQIEHLPKANHYFLSPVFSENRTETAENIACCVQTIKENPQWRLSLQIHKMIGIE